MSTFFANLIVSLGLVATPGPKDRPFMEARINDQPVHLALDTGSGRLIVFAHVADRIGLKYHKAQGFDRNRTRPGRVPLFRSDTCALRLENRDGPPLKIADADGRRRVWIAAIASGLSFAGVDGLIGWPNLSKNVLHIDWGQKTTAWERDNSWI